MEQQGNPQAEERIPLAQVFLDDIFLLFLVSLVISFVFYNLWTLLDIASVPLFK